MLLPLAPPLTLTSPKPHANAWGTEKRKFTKGVAFVHAPSSNWTEVMVNGVRYLKTTQIGRGGSSKVFRVVAPDGEVCLCVRMFGGEGVFCDKIAAPRFFFRGMG